MKRILIGLMFSVLIALTACGKAASSLSAGDINATQRAQFAWKPSGFNSFAGDATLAWRFLDSGEYSCSYSGWRCGGIEVVSQNGCDSLYSEVTVLDSGGSNIGWTNDTAQGVSPMEKVKLIFDFTEDDASQFRVAELNCHN